MRLIDLGHRAYRLAWAEQERLHAEVLNGAEPAILLVEHPPVLTMGRRGETLGVPHLLVDSAELARRGVEFVQTDRGGDITFHGPGQLVIYPVIRLADFRLSVGGYVKLLQDATIDALRGLGVASWLDPSGVGVWANDPAGGAGAKVCAIGVRVKRGVTLHGLALNVTTDLSYFELIVPCGIAGRGVTSLHRFLGERCPDMAIVKSAMVDALRRRLDLA
jgi:lipoyl(octanoyl) transferase